MEPVSGQLESSRVIYGLPLCQVRKLNDIATAIAQEEENRVIKGMPVGQYRI